MSLQTQEPQLAYPSLTKKEPSWSQVFSAGFAMFGMFFGAGNIVFPLALGQFSQGNYFYVILGLILTGVLVPLTGLLSMMLFEGNYRHFFQRIGKVPGSCLILLILALIGPLGGIPRCITISHSTLSAFQSNHALPLPLFGLLSCATIFLFTFRPRKIVSMMGYVLTPILLTSLALIALLGILKMPAPPLSPHTPWATFSHGLVGGYNTMDLLAAFFFSSVVLICLKKSSSPEKESVLSNNRSLFRVALWGSGLAALLLTIVYVGFAYLSAGYSESLASVPSHEMLGALAYQILGPYAGLMAGAVVAFACLTTEIALAAILAEYISTTLTKNRLSYTWSLGLTLALAFCVSTLHFEGISSFLVPILQCCYPALIVLAFCNLLHKVYKMEVVKTPVYLTFALTLIGYFVLSFVGSPT